MAVDAIGAKQDLKPFTEVKYVTKDGEHITATKKDGIVTLSGDKNGVRQMPLEDFVQKELLQNVAEIKLEKTPETDTVELSANAAKAAPAEQKLVEEAPKPTEPEVGKKLDVAA